MSQGEEVVLSSSYPLDDQEKEQLLYEGDPGSVDSMSTVWAGQQQNILALSLLLCLALITNLSAAPVILFRRTRCDSKNS